jgi:hypothetical protein
VASGDGDKERGNSTTVSPGSVTKSSPADVDGGSDGCDGRADFGRLTRAAEKPNSLAIFAYTAGDGGRRVCASLAARSRYGLQCHREEEVATRGAFCLSKRGGSSRHEAV